METAISKRTAVLWLTVIFGAADLAASLWASRSGSALSHTVWDICGVGFAYFILRSFFGRRSLLLPAAACLITMIVRAAQSAGAVSDILDSQSFLGGLLDRTAFTGDIVACMPAMIILFLMMKLEKRMRENELPLKYVLLAFIALAASLLPMILIPGFLLLWLVMLLVFSRSDTMLGNAVNSAAYILVSIFFAFVSYWIIMIQIQLLIIR